MMIATNTSAGIVSSDSGFENKATNLNFTYLPSYAAFLLQHKLTRFAEQQLIFSREINLPLLKHFEHFSNEELIKIGIEDITELLQACSKNTAGEFIHNALKKWRNNQLPYITRNQLNLEDLTLVSFIRRKSFRHFIPEYTDDINLSLQILNEIDSFTTYVDIVCNKELLEIQHEFFSRIQALSHIGNWQLDMNTNKLNWSDELFRIYDMEPQCDLLSETVRLYNHPDDAALVKKHMEHSAQTGDPHNFYYRIILKNGQQKTLHAIGEVRMDENKKPVEMFGTLQDVTAQKQSEKQLLDTRRFIEQVTNLSPCIITVYNPKSREYIFINDAVYAVLGYLPKTFLKKGRDFFFSLVHPDDIDSVKEFVDKIVRNSVLDAEDTFNLKYRLKHANNTYKWIHTFTKVFNRDANNNVQDILNVSVDITQSNNLSLQLQVAAEEIKSRDLSFQRMINEVEDYAIILLDEKGIIKNWNLGAEKIKGYKADEIIGNSFKIFYRKQDQEQQLPDSLLETARLNGKATHEGWRVRKDGSQFWGSIVITAIHDDDKNVIGFLKVTRNLTERKATEDTMIEYARRIEQHNKELQQINKELDSFTYMASHDLQEPLRKIKTFGNAILEKSKGGTIPDEINDYLNRIMKSTDRMQVLITSLLNYSRVSNISPNLVLTDLNEVVTFVIKELLEIIEEKNIKIKIDTLPVVKAEPTQIQQLFFNLIENAIKYSRTNVEPEIIIQSKLVQNKNEPDVYQVSVCDNGIGFESQYEEKIFKLFERLHGKYEYSGTGIGLAICKKIVENHNGTITAKSELGKGSVFTITLPCIDKN